MPEYSLIAIFLTGLLGGVHCAGMCGGIVAAFSLQRPGQKPQPLYHLAANLGRLVSYVIVGAIAGALGASSLFLQNLFPVEKVLYTVASLMLVALGLYLAGLWQGVLVLERAGGKIWQRLQPLLNRLLPIRSLPQAFAAGMLWGWLPCGLVYSVLVTALASGGVAHGALLMAAFGLGTLPNLLAMGYFAQRLQPLLRRRVVRLSAGMLVLGFGVFGLVRVAAGS
jgi:sulfite exporter TauE/SafE